MVQKGRVLENRREREEKMKHGILQKSRRG
jgi:hypothetical protein